MRHSLFNSSQKRSPVYATNYAVTDGNAGRIGVTTYANSLRYLQSSYTKPLLVVNVAPGAFMVPEGVIEDFVRTATTDNQPVEVVAYREPFERGAYDRAERMRRATKMVWNVARRHDRTKTQQHLVGHSWSWESMVAAAKSSYDLTRIASVTGLEPTGHAPMEGGATIANVLRASMAEARQVRRVLPKLGSLAIATKLAAHMAGRFLRDPVGTRSAAKAAFESEITPGVVAFKQESGIPTRVLVPSDDKFELPDTTRQHLLAGGFPAEDIITIPNANHLSVVTGSRGSELYWAIAGATAALGQLSVGQSLVPVSA